MNLRLFFITTVCLSLLTATSALAETEAELREWVRKAVDDPNVFVVNPPAELNAYADLTPEQKQQRMGDAGRGGSVLILHLNGLPYKFDSRKDFKPDGPQKLWHPNGQIASDENYASAKLVSGRYFDQDGNVLAEVQDGRGTRIEFSMLRKVDSPLEIGAKQEYADGVKNGREVRLGQGGEIRAEAFYESGKKTGVEKTWMTSGQLNCQTSWLDGQKHGEERNWYPNGQLQWLGHYEHGKSVGVSNRFYENGQIAEEMVWDRQRQPFERRWYSDGTLMLKKEFDANTGKTTIIHSFDRDGNMNGEVKDGAGSLVVLTSEAESSYAADRYELVTYTDNRPEQRVQFPSLTFHSMSSGGAKRTVEFTTAVAGPPWKSVKVEIELPEGVHSDGPLTFTSNDIAKDRPVFGPIDITFPGGEQWSGDIYASTTAETDQGSYHIKQIALAIRPRPEPVEPERPAKQEPRPRMMHLNFHNKRTVEVNGQELAQRDAIVGWSLGVKQWLLFRDPPLLVHRPDRDEPWQIVREIPYRPKGMVVMSDKSLIVWGNESTKTPEKGIPYQIEQSVDGGDSWKPFTAPQVDYLLGLGVQNNVLILAGIRLPKDGVPDGQDWFQLPRSNFLSGDGGKTFVAMAGPSFFDIGKIESRSVAPDGRRRAYIENSSWLDPSYGIYIADGLDEIPRRVETIGSEPKLVWSANSQIMAIEAKGKYFAYYDFQSGELEKLAEVIEPEALEKQRAAADEAHHKIASLLESNR